MLDARLAAEVRALFELLWSDNTHARMLIPNRTNPWVEAKDQPLVDAHKDLYLVHKDRLAALD
jgi:hypothetical protein